MATRIQHTNAITSGAQTSLTKALATAIAVGDLIIVGCLYGDDATTAAINDATLGANKDSLGNVYSTLGPLDYTSDGDFLYVFYSVATVSGSATLRVLASSGSHNIKAVYASIRPANTFSLDQAITSHYNSTPGGVLTAGTQTPTTSAGYAFNVYAGIGSLNTFTAGTSFSEQDETSDGWVVFQDDIYASTTPVVGAATSTATVENGGILALFQDAAGGGPVSKTDTDADTLAEQATLVTIKTTGQPDTATFAEQVPRIAPTPQTDALSFTEAQTVTPSSAVSKTDTDALTMADQTTGPVVGVTDVLALNDSTITLVVTDIIPAPDFTLSETQQLTLPQTDALTFTEAQTLTASFIRFVDTDTFGLAEQTPALVLGTQRDTASLAEANTGSIFILDTDATTLADRAAITALLTDLDAESFADSQFITVIGGYTGFAKGVMTVRDRLQGTLSAQDRLQGTTTTQPVGPP